jgi:5-methylcytosine-specific restriction endonuclease McrA
MKTCKQCGNQKPLSEFHRFCKICVNANAIAWRSKNPEASRNATKKYYAANREAIIEHGKEYRAENLEAARTAVRTWQKANPAIMNANYAKRRAAKLQATPMWADQSKIEEYYFAADFLGMVTGIWHHVDHIVPLQQDLVCGLHCEQNLQVLTEAENLAKGNRWWPDMPGA